MKKITILIADDHAVVRTGLAALLATESDFDVVGQARNGEEAVREAKRLKPDVVLMDLVMPKRAVRRPRRRWRRNFPRRASSS